MLRAGASEDFPDVGYDSGVRKGADREIIVPIISGDKLGESTKSVVESH